jgi:hypothetical protein
MRFSTWFENQMGPLGQQLMVLRPQLVAAAQPVYDTWEQSEDGMDDVYGGGGICDDIANAMLEVIDRSIPDLDGLSTSGEPAHGDNHYYVVLYRGQEGYAVDIPPGVYETGGGYTWQKTPDVQFDAADVQIYPVDAADVKGAIEYQGG